MKMDGVNSYIFVLEAVSHPNSTQDCNLQQVNEIDLSCEIYLIRYLKKYFLSFCHAICPLKGDTISIIRFCKYVAVVGTTTRMIIY